MPRGVKSVQSTSKEAQYQQRKSLVQRELSNATRLFARQLHRALDGAEPTLQCHGQRATRAPRRWCLVASLFGGESCHPMYALGALQLAANLPAPWSLWLAIDIATMERFGEVLRSAPNLHMVLIVQAPELAHQEAGAPERACGKRPRIMGAKWPVNTFTRYVLLDDAALAGAVVVDLDVHGAAASAALKLWRASDAAAEDKHETAFGVVNYPVGATRGMQGLRTTWNAGAVAVSRRGAQPLHFAASIAAFVGEAADEMLYGCDETWLGSASPVHTTYCDSRAAVLEVDDTQGTPVLHGVPRRPQDAVFGIYDVAVTRLPSRDVCAKKLTALANELRGQKDAAALRAVHVLLTSPTALQVTCAWSRDGQGRFALEP